MFVKLNSIFLGLLVLSGNVQASLDTMNLEDVDARPIVFFVYKGSQLIACQASGAVVGTSTIQELEKESVVTDSYQLHKREHPELYNSKKKPSAEAAQN